MSPLKTKVLVYIAIGVAFTLWASSYFIGLSCYAVNSDGYGKDVKYHNGSVRYTANRLHIGEPAGTEFVSHGVARKPSYFPMPSYYSEPDFYYVIIRLPIWLISVISLCLVLGAKLLLGRMFVSTKKSEQ
jgi:hypothetical protein